MTTRPFTWEERFRHNWEKVWEIAPYNITTREGMIDFIAQEREEAKREVVEFIKRHGYPLEKTELTDQQFYRVSEVVLKAALTEKKPN